MLEKLVNKQFQYKKLTEAEQKSRGILGRLIGPCADFMHPTRNGRKYPEDLWENVFNNPIMKEKIANRCCFGELGHPADRSEIDIEKAAICLAEQPKKGPDGKLYGVFDILSTPNGKLLKSLCDYGCKIGISSRGQGDVDDYDSTVDPKTYECETFDAVLVPGVEAARLNYVTEDYKPKKELKVALTESLKKASEEERRMMKETLNKLNLNILDEDKNEETVEEPEIADDDNLEKDLSVETPVDDDAELEPEEDEESEEDEEANIEDDVENDAEDEKTEEDIFLDFLANNFEPDQIKKVCKILDIEIIDEDEDDAKIETDSTEDDESEENIDDDAEEETSEQPEEQIGEAIDDRATILVNSLKEALKEKSNLENNVKSLQEKLAVSDTKVSNITEECDKYKDAVARLSVIAKSTKDLNENVSRLEESLKDKDEIIKTQKLRISKLAESRKDVVEKATITEDINKKVNEITALNESLIAAKKDYESQLTTLNNQLKTQTQETTNKINTLTESVNKMTNVKESYRKLANKAVNKYIDVKAEILGLTAKDIKRKLGESYTMEDVDQVCEDLKSYQLNVSRLPFSIDKKVSIKVNESASTKYHSSTQGNDDDVDDTLIKLANF